MPEPSSFSSSRRRLLSACAAAGVSGTLFPGALLGLAAAQTPAEPVHPADGPVHPAKVQTDKLPKITLAMIQAAEAIAALALTPQQRETLVESLTEQRSSVEVIRTLHLANATAPAFIFDPVPAGMVLATERKPARLGKPPAAANLAAAAGPSREEALAFATVRDLAELLRTKKATSLELTKLALARLNRYQSKLHFVINLTEQRALAQAAAADKELAAGKPRGPLHGIPWGAKDLLAVKGYPTTWGAAGFEQQQIDSDATVVQRLDAAGAVLVAKLSMGALAQGDLWFGGRTRNPWNPRQGSSGSSAGSASAVSAGCVAFALGTETLGSISSPSTRCGVTGLRPTFGFVPRTGAMALSWSMDKIGPIARSAEDCALVMSVIHGQDGQDRSVQPAAFNWHAGFDWRKLRVGYLKSAFDAPKLEELKPPTESMTEKERAELETRRAHQKENLARLTYDAAYDRASLAALEKLGVQLIPVDLPHDLHFGDQVPLLGAEAAAAFDELTLTGRDQLLTGQKPYDWPNAFRRARFYSAVDYIQAQRARSLVIDAMAKLFTQVDVIVTPTGGAQLVATNLSGHPAVILPNGLRGDDAPKATVSEEDDDLDNPGGPGTPVSLTFLGGLYSDARLLALARAYQEATGFHRKHPTLL